MKEKSDWQDYCWVPLTFCIHSRHNPFAIYREEASEVIEPLSSDVWDLQRVSL
jgi:hypothetical protein